MNDNTPWSDPRSYAPDRVEVDVSGWGRDGESWSVDAGELLRKSIIARTRPSLFYRACDALAELIANIVEHPTTSLFLVFTGIVMTVFSAVICAWLGL